MRRLLTPLCPSFAILFVSAAFAASLPSQGIPGAGEEIRFATGPYVPPPENAIRVRSNLVEIPVVVRDSSGAVVNGLVKDDFEVFDQSKKQDISFFAVQRAPRANAKELAAPPAPGEAPAAVSPAPAPAPARRPRYVAIYFDDFSMAAADMNTSRDAAEKFVRKNLDPEDMAGIFTSSTSVYQDFTGDKQKLLDALNRIRTHQKKPAETCPNFTTYQSFLIAQDPAKHPEAMELGTAQAQQCGACGVSEACGPILMSIAQEKLALSEQYSEDTLKIVSNVVTYLGNMPGRRMLVLISSGFMVQTAGPQVYREKVIDASVRAGIVINTLALDSKGLRAAPPGGDTSAEHTLYVGGILLLNMFDQMQKEIDDNPLAVMADGTGGHFFGNFSDPSAGFHELAMEPEVSYVLGFSPQNINSDGKLHTLMVRLANRKGLTVAARHAYYTPTAKEAEEDAAAAERKEKLDRGVRTNDIFTDLPAEVKTEQIQMADGSSGLMVHVHVDVKNLPFLESGGRNWENLILVAALFDASGHFLTGKEGLFNLSLTDETRKQLSTQGLNANLSLQISPGGYRLRQVVQEEVSGRLAALNAPVEVH